MSRTPSSLFLTLRTNSSTSPPLVLDLLEHLEDRLVGAAVQRAGQRVDAGGDRREQVGLARADQAHRRGGAVLLVVGVQDEQLVERLDHGGVDVVAARPGSRTSSAGSSRPARASCPGTGTAGRRSSCRRRRRSSAAWPSGARSRARPGPGRRMGRGCPGRRSTAPRPPRRAPASGARRAGSRRRSASGPRAAACAG